MCLLFHDVASLHYTGLGIIINVNIVGEPLRSIGKLIFRRPKHTKDEYIVIAPGNKAKAVVDLSKIYDLSTGGLFNVTIYGGFTIRDDHLSLERKYLEVGAGPLEIYVDKNPCCSWTRKQSIGYS